jgi:hypothetical protein
MIEDALDKETGFKLPENTLIELIQINGYLEIVLKKVKAKLTSEEKKRISDMTDRMEEIKSEYNYITIKQIIFKNENKKNT